MSAKNILLERWRVFSGKWISLSSLASQSGAGSTGGVTYNK
jgi:hypothetical protein